MIIDRDWNSVDLPSHLRACLLRGFAEVHERFGVSTADVADRLGKERRWVERKLFGHSRLSLDDASDLALAMGFELEPRVRLRTPDGTEATVPEQLKSTAVDGSTDAA